jgi:drug/metabolite transporter (DMT)-like permease
MKGRVEGAEDGDIVLNCRTIVRKMKKQITSARKFVGPGSLLLVGILFGLSGVMAKYLSSSLNPYQVVEYRFAIALLAALVLIVVLRKKIQFGNHDKKALVLFAVSFPISVILFTLAIFNTSVALAVFSFYIATLVSSFVLGRVFFGERIHVYKQVAFGLVLLALLVFTDPLDSSTLGIGFVFGLLSGVVQGVASSFQKKLSGATDKLSLLVLQTASGMVLAAIVLLAIQEPLVASLTGFEWLVAAVFGMSMLAISYLFLVGFKYTNLNTGSILVSSELFFGPLFAFLLLGEGLGIRTIIGGILIGVATIFSHIVEPHKQKI